MKTGCSVVWYLSGQESSGDARTGAKKERSICDKFLNEEPLGGSKRRNLQRLNVK
jgi:hypothetical protein